MDSNKVFTQLKSILEQYEPSLTVLHNKSDNYYLNTPPTETNKKPEFFDAVQIKKFYVAVHLMPIYYYPALLDRVSEELKNKMQGKSCFNFKDIDNDIFEELKSLAERCFEKYKELNKI
jgi:hypothetical protein